MLINKILFSSGVLIATLLISFVFKKAVDLVFSGVKRKVANTFIIAKTKTLRSLLKNIIDTVLIVTGILVILSYWGVNIAPILTGAGILGLAFSFGAQTFVKDVISGFLIVLENQFNIGDFIRVDKYEGEVYRMTLRMTVLRDKMGNLVYIPNSQISTVVKLKREIN